MSGPGSIAKLTQGWREDMLAQHKRVAAIYEARGTTAVKRANTGTVTITQYGLCYRIVGTFAGVERVGDGRAGALSAWPTA